MSVLTVTDRFGTGRPQAKTDSATTVLVSSLRCSAADGTQSSVVCHDAQDSHFVIGVRVNDINLRRDKLYTRLNEHQTEDP